MYVSLVFTLTQVCSICLNLQGSITGSSNGWVELVLIEARDLIAADLRGTSDPYVRVNYGNLKRRTKVRNLAIQTKVLRFIFSSSHAKA